MGLVVVTLEAAVFRENPYRSRLCLAIPGERIWFEAGETAVLRRRSD